MLSKHILLNARQAVKRLLCFAAIAAAAAMPPAHATVVYSNNFDAPATTALGASSSLTVAGGGLDASVGTYAGTYGSYFRNSTTGATTLTLTGLPVHTSASLSYILGFLESWDSRNGSCCAPDNVDFYIDGVLQASYTYNNALGSITDFGGGTVLHQYVQFNGNTFYSDTIVNMAGDPLLSFAHSSSTLTFAWQASGGGWQGGSDEAWGIDNLVVNLGGVSLAPAPATLLLLLAGLAGIAGSRRLRQQA